MKDPSGSGFASAPASVVAKIRQRKAPSQARARVTVDAVLEATLQILLEAGPAGLSTTEVAERAGVSVGTLYQYYPDKRALVAALKARYVQGLVAAVEEAVRAGEGAPPRDALRGVVLALLAYKRDNLRLAQAVRAFAPDLGDRETVAAAGAALIGATRGLVLAVAPGTADPVLTARVLVGAVEGALGAAVFESPELFDSEAYAEELVRLATAYLGAR